MLENGFVDCAGESGTACEFTVVSAGQGRSAIKLRNVAQPHFHLAVVNGYFVGYVSAYVLRLELHFVKNSVIPDSIFNQDTMHAWSQLHRNVYHAISEK